MKVLVTGFEPFGKHRLNPSKEIVLRLAPGAVAGVELATAVLPVHRKNAPEQLLAAFDAARPDAVVLLGEAGGAVMPAVERVYVNLIEYSAELGGGEPVADVAIRPGGPAAYFSTLPVREIVADALAAAIPVRLSLSAGTYICNEVGYVMQDHLRRIGSEVPAGLLHVPLLPEQAAGLPPGGTSASMSLETQVRFVSVVLGTLSRMRGAGL